MEAKTSRLWKLSMAVLYFIVSIGAMIYLSGCSGTGDIPSASKAESGSVELFWEGIPGATAYNIYMSTSPGVNRLNGYRLSRAASPLTITGLEDGTTYYFVLTVIGVSGEGRESDEMAYTAASDGTGSVKLVPRPVESPEEEQQSANRPKTSEKPAATGQITVAWNSVPNASSYNICWRKAPGVTTQNGTKITGIQSPYTFSGLKHGITYFFVVTSVSQTGESQASEEFSFSLPE